LHRRRKDWWHEFLLGPESILLTAPFHYLVITLGYIPTFLACLLCVPFASCCCRLPSLFTWFVDHGERRNYKIKTKKEQKLVALSCQPKFFGDAPLHSFEELEVFCLPVLSFTRQRMFGQPFESFHGIVLRPVKEQSGQFVRMGTFTVEHRSLWRRFPVQTFTLA
jgi:hypothetical protein